LRNIETFCAISFRNDQETRKQDLVIQAEKGVCLTEEGKTIAKKVIRRTDYRAAAHRYSGFKWHEVHEEAAGSSMRLA